jgi:hypothetical protein
MKKTDNISSKLEQIKSNYKVPEGYFEQLQFSRNNLVKQKKKIIVFNKKWMVAASIILLVSLGYKILNWQQQKLVQDISHTINVTSVTKETKINLSDISEEEIIEYFLENNIETDEF